MPFHGPHDGDASSRPSQDLRVLQRINHALNTTLDLGEVLQRLIVELVQLLAAQSASVILHEDGTSEANLVTTYGKGTTVQSLRYPLAGSLTGWVAVHRRPLRVPRLTAEEWPVVWRLAEQLGEVPAPVAVLLVPLWVQGRVSGSLEVVWKPAHTITDHDEQLLEAIAMQAAIAITNARLYQEKERALREAKEREEQYRSLFENTRDAMATWTVEETITSVNRGAELLLGWSREELIGRSVSTVATPAAVAVARDRTRRWLAGEKIPSLFEIELVRKDGTVAPVEARTRGLRDRAGRLIGFQGIFRDIAERKRAEEILRRLSVAVNMSTDSIVLTDLEGTITDVNDATLRMYGAADKGDLIGKSAFALIVPAERERAVAGMEETREHAALTHREHTIIAKDGHTIPVEMSVALMQDEAGAPLGFVGISRDITERKRAEEALRHREQYFRALIENTLDVVTIVNSDGSLRYVSPSGERLYGYALEEIVGKEGWAFVHPEDLPAVRDAFSHAIQHPGVSIRVEFRVRHKDGTWRVMEAIGRSLLEEPAVAGIVVNSRDITERKQAEAMLQQAKDAAEAANRAKSEFLATMSHELRTPLSVILGYTMLLREGAFGRLDAALTDTVRRIDLNARGLLELITSVLDLSRLEAGRLPVERQAVNLPALLREVETESQEVREQSGLAFVWRLEAGLPPVHTDAGKLKVVLKNLIGNAVKFTKTGNITVAAYSRERGVEISVTDTGVGIPPEALALIFEPFRQVPHASSLSSSGTGLGLYIVRRLLEVLSGKISVESYLGRGTTFRVWLPT